MKIKIINVNLYLLLSLLLIWNICNAEAAPYKQHLANILKINIKFDWNQTQESPIDYFSGKPIHILKTVYLDKDQKDYKVAITLSKVANKHPVTLALLVKPTNITEKHVGLTFRLLQYGTQSHTLIVWTEPHIILENGKLAEFHSPISGNPHLSIKVSGTWS